MRRVILIVLGALLAWLLLLLLNVVLDAQRPIPLCRAGECIDEVTGADREGQPQWCQNKDERGWAANCQCVRRCNEREGTGCKSSCRRRACRCDHGCPVTVSEQPRGLCIPRGQVVEYEGILYGCNGQWKVKQLALRRR